MFITAGLTITFRVRGRLDDLLALLIIASMGLLLLWIWRYATGPRGFRSSSIDPSVVGGMSIRIALGPLLCLVGAIVSLANPHLGTLLFMMVPLAYVSQPKVDASWRAVAEDA